jgi:chromate transporter
LLASFGFTLPSALLMIAFGYGVALVRDPSGAGWLHGLKLAAVVVVAQAVWGMGKNLCPDRARRTLALGSAALLLVWPSAVAQLAVIGVGALLGRWLYRADALGAPSVEPASRTGRVAGAAALLAFGALLVVLPALAAAAPNGPVAVFDSFYRSGALVFGGGHVVLPLLHAELVPRGWLSDDQFLAGYGAAQALPGPLFTFAAYLGTAMSAGAGAWRNGLWCLLGIFLPAWLLIGGALPFWRRLRGHAGARGALAGANAAVVGLLVATLYSPVIVQGVRGPLDVAAALVGFGVLELWRAPSWAVVLLMAAAGQWWLPT